MPRPVRYPWGKLSLNYAEWYHIEQVTVSLPCWWMAFHCQPKWLLGMVQSLARVNSVSEGSEPITSDESEKRRFWLKSARIGDISARIGDISAVSARIAIYRLVSAIYRPYRIKLYFLILSLSYILIYN